MSMGIWFWLLSDSISQTAPSSTPTTHFWRRWDPPAPCAVFCSNDYDFFDGGGI